MFQAEHIRKQYGDVLILDDVSLSVRPGERAALVGRNGAGKTTLLRILAGEIEPDRGEIIAPRTGTVAYLPQHGVAGSDRPLWEETLSVFEAVFALESEQRELEARLEQNELSVDESTALIERHHELQVEFDRLDGYSVDARVGSVLSGLGFSQADHSKPVNTFSGGWQMRAALAKLLLMDADLLLLDEPTNHLDLQAVEWLEDYLQKYRGSVLIVSHDRYFLDRVSTVTYELASCQATRYAGAYSFYIQERERRIVAQEAAYERQQEYLAGQMAFVERFRASARRSTQAKSREKALAKIERIEAPAREAELAFRLPAPPPSGREVLSLRGASKAYGDNVVLDNIDYLVEGGDKLALVGPNGAGKSTLLRLMARLEKPDRGYAVHGDGVVPAYYAQDQAESLNQRNTVLDEVYGAAPVGTPVQLVRTHLGRLLFRQEEVFKRVADLSGGERSRVALAKLLLRPANLLLLDEPTNHLDVAAKEHVETALRDFAGTVVVASHDRYFLDQFVTKTLEVRDAGIKLYLGNYTYYRQRRLDEAARTASDVAPKPRRAQTRRDQPATESSKRSSPERRLSEVEAEIAALETRIAELAEELAAPDAYSGGQRPAGLDEYEASSERLATLQAEWEEIVEAL